MEYWDLYDRDRNLLPGTMQRGDPQPAGTYHLVVHLCIFNSDGEMLIQHRQKHKRGWPNRWDFSAGGSAVKGDDTHTAITREAAEELGYHHDFSNESPVLTIHFDTGFDDFYIVNDDVDLSALALQTSEISEVKWASLEEVLTLVETDQFIPHHKGFIELLFHMRHAPTTQTKEEHPNT